ncbi:MAG: pimelyl-ACP methyl ester esterase BioV [Sulfuricurvum sp.]|nr:pimelyl-ACP methyl ester esterase BioV [Sulfuricurvum sp.]
MTFYSGFSLINDQRFFDAYLVESDYTVAGFSYGAIKAARHAANSTSRIDTLQLFSPAFFQTAKSSFKRLQLASFISDPVNYRERFVHGCFAPCEVQHLDLKMGTMDELEEVLNFVWEDLLLEKILEKGIRIEVYLGMKDHIIDAAAARAFFLSYATVTSMPLRNHFLQECT